MVRTTYAIAAWALALLGVLHAAATSRYFTEFSPQALWFLSGGVLMVFGAALNLLNREYGRVAPGLRRVCVAGNFVILGFAVAGGLVGRATLSQWVVVLAILVPLTSLSWSRAATAIDHE